MKVSRVAVVLLCVSNLLLATMFFTVLYLPISSRGKRNDAKLYKCAQTTQQTLQHTGHQEGTKPVRHTEAENSKYVLDAFTGNDGIDLFENMEFDTRNKSDKAGNLCPEKPPLLEGELKPLGDGTSPSWSILTLQNILVNGGSFAPQNCVARHRVAVIIPMYGEVELLKALLHHLHPVLKRQQLEYTVYTITLSGTGPYNRAKLLNVGFAEANRDREYDCYIFHDVNLLVENDECLYWCSDEPRHISCYVDKFNYKALSYPFECSPEHGPKTISYSGGVVSMPHNAFVEINGFSNLYWGWGGDDDDLFYRLWKAKAQYLTNPYGRTCSFTMMEFRNKQSFERNLKRFPLIYHAMSRMQHDGLNTLRYKRIAFERTKLYTDITVDLGKPSEEMERFMSTPAGYTCKSIHMPWL